MDGAEATAAIRYLLPDIKALLFTTFADDATIFAALEAVVAGQSVLENASHAALLLAVRRAQGSRARSSAAGRCPPASASGCQTTQMDGYPC